MTLKGRGGIQYNLEASPFAMGGEGEVYQIVGMQDKVAKLYRSNVSIGDRETKLNVMAQNPPDSSVLSQIAWPTDVLYNGSAFIGFVMPKVKINEELNVIYEYGNSAKYPTMTWRNKITVAKNLCAVLDAVHNAGHVVGDLNPKNISVDPNTGHIVMVDTDSYHIEDGKYRCSVGMPEYLSVEIQMKMKGAGLASVSLPTFSKDTDNFALAVHIFQLLMNGVHPFACAVIPSQASVANPMTSDSILKGECAFLQNVQGKTIPKFAPSIDILSKELQDMFKQAFIDGHKDPSIRPNAVEWHGALTKLEKNIKICGNKNFHEYWDSLKTCPWCEADNRFTGALSVSKSTLTQSTISRPAVAPPTYMPPPSSYNYLGGNAGNVTPSYVSNNLLKKRNKFIALQIILRILAGLVIVGATPLADWGLWQTLSGTEIPSGIFWIVLIIGASEITTIGFVLLFCIRGQRIKISSAFKVVGLALIPIFNLFAIFYCIKALITGADMDNEFIDIDSARGRIVNCIVSIILVLTIALACWAFSPQITNWREKVWKEKTTVHFENEIIKHYSIGKVEYVDFGQYYINSSTEKEAIACSVIEKDSDR